MRRALLLVAAVAIVACAFALFAPATLADAWLERASGGAVVLADAAGTLWRGRGTLVAGEGRLPIGWALDPWPLLRGEVRFSLLPFDEAGGTPGGAVTLRDRAISVRALELVLPARALTSLAPRSGVRVLGEVHVSSPSLDWTPAAFDGGVRLEWRDARFAFAAEPPIALGTVTAALSAGSGPLAGPLTNEGGDLGVRGTIAVAPSGAPDVSVTMTPRTGDATQTHTLSIVRSANGTGWRVDYRAGGR
jgi:hypothetical protein